MGDRTGIEWTDATWNPIRGCSRVSDGCRNCYAELVAARFSGPGQAYEGLARRRSNGEPQWTGDVRVIESHMLDPIRWQKPRRIFVNSMSDLFHENVSDETILRIFTVMAEAERHTFQVLTKRPERMLRWFTEYLPEACSGERPAERWPLPNVWLGVSVEHQAAADERIPLLLQTPAAVRFLSCEPLLGDVDLSLYLEEDGYIDDQYVRPLDWVIVGGESGPHARPLNTAWVSHIVQDCLVNSVAVFVKQLGAVPMESESVWRSRPLVRLLSANNRDRVPEGFVPLKMSDRHGGAIEEFPADLQIREFPAAVGR